MGDQTVHGSIWKGVGLSSISTHLHHRHVPEERHQSGEGIGREEHATFGDDAENLRRDEEKW
jgi:hypothetical protein